MKVKFCFTNNFPTVLFVLYLLFLIIGIEAIASLKSDFLDKGMNAKKKHKQRHRNITHADLIKSKIPIVCILGLFYNKTADNSVTRNNVIDTRVDSSYVHWLISGGSEVMVIDGDNENSVEKELYKCDAVLFQHAQNGNKIQLKGTYEAAASLIYNKVKSINEKGSYLPLLAIGNGAELVQVIEAKSDKVIQDYQQNLNAPNTTKNIIEKGIMTSNEIVISDVRRARMLFYFDGRDILNLGNKNSTAHYHKYGVPPNAYSIYNELQNTFKIVAISNYSHEKTGNFISMFEAYRYPIYGVEFDPARYVYSRYYNSALEMNNEAVTIGQKILNFFIKEAFTSLYKKLEEGKYKNNLLYSSHLEGVDIYADIPTYFDGEGYFYIFEHQKLNKNTNDLTTSNSINPSTHNKTKILEQSVSKPEEKKKKKLKKKKTGSPKNTTQSDQLTNSTEKNKREEYTHEFLNLRFENLNFY